MILDIVEQPENNILLAEKDLEARLRDYAFSCTEEEAFCLLLEMGVLPFDFDYRQFTRLKKAEESLGQIFQDIKHARVNAVVRGSGKHIAYFTAFSGKAIIKIYLEDFLFAVERGSNYHELRQMVDRGRLFTGAELLWHSMWDSFGEWKNVQVSSKDYRKFIGQLNTYRDNRRADAWERVKGLYCPASPIKFFNAQRHKRNLVEAAIPGEGVIEASTLGSLLIAAYYHRADALVGISNHGARFYGYPVRLRSLDSVAKPTETVQETQVQDPKYPAVHGTNVVQLDMYRSPKH